MNYIKQLRKAFPEVIFKLGRKGQLEHVIKECEEAKEQINRNTEHYLMELVDVVHTASNALYKSGFSDKQINYAINKVKIKNDERGYYK